MSIAKNSNTLPAEKRMEVMNSTPQFSTSWKPLKAQSCGWQQSRDDSTNQFEALRTLFSLGFCKRQTSYLFELCITRWFLIDSRLLVKCKIWLSMTVASCCLYLLDHPKFGQGSLQNFNLMNLNFCARMTLAGLLTSWLYIVGNAYTWILVWRCPVGWFCMQSTRSAIAKINGWCFRTSQHCFCHFLWDITVFDWRHVQSCCWPSSGVALAACREHAAFERQLYFKCFLSGWPSLSIPLLSARLARLAEIPWRQKLCCALFRVWHFRASEFASSESSNFSWDICTYVYVF